jgi:hypothetical protein
MFTIAILFVEFLAIVTEGQGNISSVLRGDLLELLSFIVTKLVITFLTLLLLGIDLLADWFFID